MSTRCRQETSAALKALARSGQLRRVFSCQRLNVSHFFARKTYIYTVGVSPLGHLFHWLCISHMKALFTVAARDLGLALDWSQSVKHSRFIPDATVTISGERLSSPLTYYLEVDNSTEGYRPDLMARFKPNTLFIAFKSKARLEICERPGWDGVAAYHGHFHEVEGKGFSILTSPCWWDGRQWVSLV